MLNKLFIETKLKINAGVVVLGLLILTVLSYNSITKLQQYYEESSKISDLTENYKSMLVGGLLANSASVTFAFDPASMNPVKVAKSGLKKAIDFSKGNKFENDSIFLNFTSTYGRILDEASRDMYLTPEQVQNLLKAWRPLKKELMSEIKNIQAKQEKLSNKFKESLGVLLRDIMVVIGFITLFVMMLNFLISKGIISSLSILENSMKNLALGNDSKKIELQSQDETTAIANYFNQYMDNIRAGIEQDKKVIGETKVVIEKVNAGLLNTTVKGHANSQEVEDLVKELNGMIKTMSSNLSELSSVLTDFGNSKFDTTVPYIQGVTGLVASMFSGVRATGNTVSELLALIDNSNKRLMYGSKDLTTSSQNLSNSSNAQAASLEETAAAVEEVTSTISSTTENTSKMSVYAKEVTKSADEGKQLAVQTATSMDEINEQVTSINDAITVIDQIAFQTNILSLNAAVEAATAGEAGKGFAVVAQEVRNLASRSAEAAKEIKDLVQNATLKASEGKKISANMIDGYTKLNENIDITIELIDHVTNASKEQYEAMNQINDAITSLDKSTQQNASEAANISEMARVNEELASNLQIAIDRASFKDECKRRVCDVEMIFDTAKLKLNHLEFKNYAFDKSGDGKSFKVKGHHECELGHWIDSHENHEMANSKVWSELKDAHKNVHQMTQDIVDLHAGGYDNGQLFAVAKNVEENINVVFKALNDIREVNCDNQFRKKQG